MSVKNSLTAPQRRCAEMLATNDIHQLTLAQIAEDLGVSERTIYRWKQDPKFVAYLNEISEQTMEAFLSETYNVLKRIVVNGRNDHSKLKAIELFLKNRGRLTDVGKQEITVKDDRSTDAINNEIEDLKRLLNGE